MAERCAGEREERNERRGRPGWRGGSSVRARVSLLEEQSQSICGYNVAVEGKLFESLYNNRGGQFCYDIQYYDVVQPLGI